MVQLAKTSFEHLLLSAHQSHSGCSTQVLQLYEAQASHGSVLQGSVVCGLAIPSQFESATAVETL
jgi:hypothetical protein